eukprot:Hpha_TRINITY_DN15404_c0_g1::TRINITY_DN15404_c0_g1_i3::g.173212::m.173212/K01363/CTSB; cathepsin B
MRVAVIACLLPAAAALPPGFDPESVAYADANRARIVAAVNSDPTSPWRAGAASRFEGRPYSALLRDGAGIQGGDPRENAAGLQLKTHESLSKRYSGAIPASFESEAEWGKVCPSLSEIRDQSACGSCYAVATASAATDRWCIANNGSDNTRLSAVDLMSCCFTCKGANGGCYGGTPSHCWDYMTQQGIASGGDYGDHSKCLMYPFGRCSHHINGTYPQCPAATYTAPTCFWACDSDSTSKVSYDKDQASHMFGTSYKVDKDVKAIQTDILAHGPVAAGMFLVTEFEVYSAGVFTTKSTDYIGAHAVKIVGWGHDSASGLDYWRVQNSWNPEWGENGYFRIARGQDILAIESSVVGGSVQTW